jgi:Asp-tRNA(Asn)/Glu-tRNA(Gln) amidotransferase A subunit family amidase
MLLGTDTVNSLRSPAASNSLFSIRPTRGLITRAGIIPVSFTQDTIGPIARTVSDLAKALTVMASIGYDPADNATALIPATSVGVDYTSYLTNANVKGKRLGFLNGLINRTTTSEITPVYTAIDAMMSVLTAAGAIIVPIDDPIYNSANIAVMDVQAYELRAAIDAYLSSPVIGGTHPYSLSQLYHNNSDKFLVIPNHYPFLSRSLVSSPADPGYAIIKLGIQNLTIAVAKTFATHKLDAMIYPEQQNLVVKVGSPGQTGRNGILAGLSGSPVVVVPAGFSPPTADAPIGVPIGMEILGLPWTEGKLLNIAAGIEEIRHLRRTPVFADMSAPWNNGSVMSVPTITPDRWNISPNYPSRG